MSQENISQQTNFKPLPLPPLQTKKFIIATMVQVWVVVAAYVLLSLITVSIVVDGPSMQPTLNSGQVVLVSRLAYLTDEPKHGDIVVFSPPLNEDTTLVKRLIGLPGDTVELRDTQVYLNGSLLDEPYLREQCSLSNCANRIWQLGTEDYFVLGDNRNRSVDSRSFGVIQRQHMLGRIILRYLPLADITTFN